MSAPIRNGDNPVETRHLDMTYDSTDSNASALTLIYSLYPSWKHDEGPVEFTRFTEGITNTVGFPWANVTSNTTDSSASQSDEGQSAMHICKD